MAGPFAQIVFWILVAAAAAAHGFILRSTMRGMRAADPRARGGWEWVWAVLPAVSLALLLVWTWQTMHPDALNITLPANRVAPGGITS